MSVIVSANDLSSSLHRVRSSHIYENEHLYSLYVSGFLCADIHSLGACIVHDHRYTEYGCQFHLSQKLEWSRRLLPALTFGNERNWFLGYTTIL